MIRLINVKEIANLGGYKSVYPNILCKYSLDNFRRANEIQKQVFHFPFQQTIRFWALNFSIIKSSRIYSEYQTTYILPWLKNLKY